MNRGINVEEEKLKNKLASNRVVVEIYFWRLCTLWIALSNKYRWSEYTYTLFVKLYLGLTNAHVR